jgi:hypothetical protein
MRVLNLHWNPGVQIDMIRIDYSVGRSFKLSLPPKKTFLTVSTQGCKKMLDMAPVTTRLLDNYIY